MLLYTVQGTVYATHPWFNKILKAVAATPLVMDLTTAMITTHTCSGRNDAQ